MSFGQFFEYYILSHILMGLIPLVIFIVIGIFYYIMEVFKK